MTSDLKSPDSTEWDATADVVVVGSGSGLFAAVEAATSGASVILLEKANEIGGKPQMMFIWDANSTDVQKRAGIDDSADAHWEWLKQQSPWATEHGAEDLKRIWIDHSGEVINRMEELGFTFKLQNQNAIGDVPRLHVVQNSLLAWPEIMGSHARKLGVDIRVNTAATELITRSGEVIGIRAQTESGNSIAIKARRGVVLATGDTTGSKRWKSRYYSSREVEVPGLFEPNTGDGLVMAQEIGADVWGLSLFSYSMPRISGFVKDRTDHHVGWLYPEVAAGVEFTSKGLIFVNKDGRRFTDELSDDATYDVNEQRDHTAYMIFGNELAEYLHRPKDGDNIAAYDSGKSFHMSLLPFAGQAYLEDYLEFQDGNYIRVADSISELAEKLGLDRVALQETIDSWNASVISGQDKEFGRQINFEYDDRVTGGEGKKMVKRIFGNAEQIASGPYYALVTHGAKNFLHEGPNLIVDTSLQVLHVREHPIPRLFACGPGLLSSTRMIAPQQGDHMTFAGVTGYLAGKTVAQVAPWE